MKTSFLCSLPISGGTDCTDFLAVQRQPDLDQEEQQHVHPLWRDGFLADERHSRQSTDRCLKYELRYLMTCDLATYLLNIGARLRWPPNRVHAMISTNQSEMFHKEKGLHIQLFHTADKKWSALFGLQIFRERPNLATEDAQFEWIS